MPLNEAEIILACTAPSGSSVLCVCMSERETLRGRTREGRLDLEWQQLACLSVV